jgi:hypothetical protein
MFPAKTRQPRPRAKAAPKAAPRPRGRPKGRPTMVTVSSMQAYPYRRQQYRAPAMEQPRVSRQTAARIFTGTQMSKIDALNYFDPNKNTSMCVNIPSSLGSFICLNSTRRFIHTSLAATPGDHYLIFVQTYSDLLGFTMAGNYGTSARQLVPIFSNDLLGSYPDTMRPSRYSMNIANVTNNQTAEQSISISVLPNGLNFNLDAWTSGDLYLKASAAMVTSLNTITDSHPKTTHLTHNELRVGRNIIAIPSSHVGFTTWREFIPSFNQGVVVSNPISLDQRNAMLSILELAQSHQSQSTIIVRIRQTAVINSYNVILRHQFAGRYPSNNVISTLENIDHGIVMNEQSLKTLTDKASLVPAGSSSSMGIEGAAVGLS